MKIKSVFLIFCVGLIFSSCAEKKSERKSDVQNVNKTNERKLVTDSEKNPSALDASAEKSSSENSDLMQENIPFGISQNDYENLLQISLMSTGNNLRLKNLIEKMRRGDDVFIAALGGSVTEGAGPKDFKDGYAYQFFNDLKKQYSLDGKNLYFDNAGLSGTPSELGLIRYESDVVEVLGKNPDLLIIEFAVNDDGQNGSTKAFEAIVRNALKNGSAVIALYSAAQYGNSAGVKKQVSEFYKIPQVNVLNLLNEGVRLGYFKENQYYTDNVHPTKEGHKIQSDCIMNLFRKIDAAEKDEDFAIPKNWIMEKPLTDFKRIFGDDENVKITAGDFYETDAHTQVLQKNNKSDFPQNWHHKSGENSFKMEINCKALILAYKEQGSWLPQKFGKADVFVDGKLFKTFDGGKSGGWCNGVPVYLIDEEKSALHTVEIKMADGDEDKGFTIVAMGYSK